MREPFRSFWKEPRGTFRRERIAKTLAREAAEREGKAHAKARDGHKCRWPRCAYPARFNPIEVAHVADKSTGGSNEARNLMVLCREHHQGARSLHSKDLAIVPLYASMGTDGPCEFLARSESGRMETVAVERTVGISEPRA